MTRFVSSAPTERAFMRDKSWQHPSRRQHVHGPIRPMVDEQPRWWRVVSVVVMVVTTVYALKLAVMG